MLTSITLASLLALAPLPAATASPLGRALHRALVRYHDALGVELSPALVLAAAMQAVESGEDRLSREDIFALSGEADELPLRLGEAVWRWLDLQLDKLVDLARG